jgi:hypothetical protein
VTECALTAANLPDGPTGLQLLAGEAPGLEVLSDSGYGSGPTRAALRAAGHTQTIKPIPLQGAVPGGFTIHDFRLDRQAGILRCPAGSRRRSPAPAGSAWRVTARVARCAGAAPPPSVAASSTCTLARTSCAPPDAGR